MKLVIPVLLFLFFINADIALARGNKSDEAVSLKAYTEKLISEGYDVMNDPAVSREDRLKFSEQFVRKNLYFPWMAKYTLGRYRKTISNDKIEEFTEIYSKFVIQAYTDLAKNYNGQKAVVKDVRVVDENLFMVESEIIKPGASSAIRVEYLVHKLDLPQNQEPYRVGDVITEGVSILNSQQAEFANILADQGIDALIENLKNKLETKK